MMILWKQKLTVFAVPKTGTTAIHQAIAPYSDIQYLNPPQAKHMNVRKYNRFMRKYLHSIGDDIFETVAVIREPISWLGSWYRYRQRPDLDRSKKSTKNISFDDFVLGYLQIDNRPDYAAIGGQAAFLCPEDGELGVDYLFAYERISELIRFLEDRIGSKLDVPAVNVSPPRQLHLSADIDLRLRQALAADFALHASVSSRAGT